MRVRGSSGNVFADLGFRDADQMLVKAQHVTAISEVLTARQWTQQQASKVLGIPQPKLSKMLRGQFRGISEAKMMQCLTRLGRNIRIVIGSESSPNVIGEIQVQNA
jgi:predicted XRE-type DNA-binding protein